MLLSRQQVENAPSGVRIRPTGGQNGVFVVFFGRFTTKGTTIFNRKFLFEGLVIIYDIKYIINI
jgi:hypothetical protein